MSRWLCTRHPKPAPCEAEHPGRGGRPRPCGRRCFCEVPEQSGQAGNRKLPGLPPPSRWRDGAPRIRRSTTQGERLLELHFEELPAPFERLSPVLNHAAPVARNRQHRAGGLAGGIGRKRALRGDGAPSRLADERPAAGVRPAGKTGPPQETGPPRPIWADPVRCIGGDGHHEFGHTGRDGDPRHAEGEGSPLEVRIPPWAPPTSAAPDAPEPPERSQGAWQPASLTTAFVRPSLLADCLVMDKAAEGDEAREMGAGRGLEPVVPPKANRVSPWEYERELYKKRNEGERLFRQLKRFRCVFCAVRQLDRLHLLHPLCAQRRCPQIHIVLTRPRTGGRDDERGRHPPRTGPYGVTTYTCAMGAYTVALPPRGRSDNHSRMNLFRPSKGTLLAWRRRDGVEPSAQLTPRNSVLKTGTATGPYPSP